MRSLYKLRADEMGSDNEHWQCVPKIMKMMARGNISRAEPIGMQLWLAPGRKNAFLGCGVHGNQHPERAEHGYEVPPLCILEGFSAGGDFCVANLINV